MKTKKAFSILHYTFYILLILTIIACSSTTEVSKGSLTGIVNLDGLEDHSGIIVALYDLAYLDTTIVRINNQYPHIGVIINQHTEFDHRLQAPIKSTETDIDGSFEIKKIPTGTYNFVAIKDSFGFKYLYEIEISKGDNDLSQLTILYAETLFTDQVPTTTFLTDHHYIIDNPYGEVVLYNNSLIIQPGAVVRITPYTDFVIAGILTAQGEENNMFWITSNSGLENSQLTIQNSPLSSEDILLYNSMELSSIAIVENDLITWGKWDYANICLLNQVNNLHMQNGIFRKGNCGFYSALSSAEDDSTFCRNVLCENIEIESNAGIFYLYVNNGVIEKSILYNCYNGCKIKDGFTGNIINCLFEENYNGLYMMHFIGSILYNDFKNNAGEDIKFTGNNYVCLDSNKIYYNNFYSEKGIRQYWLDSYVCTFTLEINHNNFYNDNMFITYDSNYLLEMINASNNYFNGFANESTIREKINDTFDGNTDEIIINPFSLTPILNSGIQ